MNNQLRFCGKKSSTYIIVVNVVSAGFLPTEVPLDETKGDNRTIASVAHSCFSRCAYFDPQVGPQAVECRRRFFTAAVAHCCFFVAHVLVIRFLTKQKKQQSMDHRFSFVGSITVKCHKPSKTVTFLVGSYMVSYLSWHSRSICPQTRAAPQPETCSARRSRLFRPSDECLLASDLTGERHYYIRRPILQLIHLFLRRGAGSTS